jgi:hypothetical protein
VSYVTAGVKLSAAAVRSDAEGGASSGTSDVGSRYQATAVRCDCKH